MTQAQPTNISRVLGKRCCWDSNIPCGATCQMVWRIWIILLATILLGLNIIQTIMIFVILSQLWDNKEIFISDRMSKILMLTDGFLPLWLLVILLSASMVALWSIALILRPTKATHAGIVAYRIITSIITLSIFIGSIYQFVIYFLEWPDKTYKRDVKMWMFNDMLEKNPPNSITKTWLDTQEYFQCCGISAAKDWTDVINSKMNDNESITLRNSDLPPSCCHRKTGNCIESYAWTIGCIEAQMDTLKSYSNLNIWSSSVLYFLIDGLIGSVKKYFKKFPIVSLDQDYEPIDNEDVDYESPQEYAHLKPLVKDKKTKPMEEYDEHDQASGKQKIMESNIGKLKKPESNNKILENNIEQYNASESYNPEKSYSQENLNTFRNSLPSILEGNIFYDSKMEDYISENDEINLVEFTKHNREDSESDSQSEFDDTASFSSLRNLSKKKRPQETDFDVVFSAYKMTKNIESGFNVAREDDSSSIRKTPHVQATTPKKIRPYLINNVLSARQILGNNGNIFPDFHVWKGLPSQSLNDS